MPEKVEMAQNDNFTFFYNVFYAVCTLKSFISHISDVVWSFFEFGTDSKSCIGNGLTHFQIMTPFDAPGKQAFWKHVGKGEIARNEQFLLFPQCFLPVWIAFYLFRQIWNCCLQTLSVLKSLKLSSGNGLTKLLWVLARVHNKAFENIVIEDYCYLPFLIGL